MVAVRSFCAAVLVSLVVVGVPAGATAFDGYYNCVLKPSWQWCDGKANGTYDGLHSWDFNEAWYPGPWDNTVTACQRLIKPSDGSVLVGNNCAANWASSSYSVTCVCYRAEAMQISGGPHSINGHAVAN
jgi:hypothetical protein